MNGIAFLLDYYDIHGEQCIYKFLLLSTEFLSPGKKQPTTQLTYFNKEQKNVSLACVQKILRKEDYVQRLTCIFLSSNVLGAWHHSPRSPAAVQGNEPTLLTTKRE